MHAKLPRRVDGIYQEFVIFVQDTWKNNPFRIPVLLLVALLTTTASVNLLYNPRIPNPVSIPTAKANTYQFVPTSGNLVTGTEQNANSLLAAAAEGVNTGSWKGTLADDNFHWQVTAADAATPNLNMQLDLGIAKVSGANKLLIQTEVDLDSASRLLKIQICDWVSSTSVDAAADSECTTGGWRSLMTKTAANVDVDVALTTGAAFQWHIYDGYFSSGTGGGTTISTPLTNFTSSDTQPLRIRYWSDSDVVGSGDVAVDFLRATAFVDSVYHPSGVVNQNGSGGALTGTYANAHVVGNSATAQQSVTTGNAIRLEGAGTAGSVADYYLQFKNVKTYTGSNSFYFKADYSCSANTAGLDHKFSLYNFTTTTWTDFNSAVIACSTTDATNAWAISSITPADYIDESSSDEVRVRFLGDLNSTTTLRLDFAYLMLGSVNDNSANCEVTWGSGTATDCANTRDLIGPATPSVFANAAETRSNTANNDYYALDCEANTTADECAAANIDFPVTVPSDGQVVVNHFATRFAGDLVGTTNPDLTANPGLRDYSGTPTSTSGAGGWTLFGSSSATSTQLYGDSIISTTINTYGNQINPDDHVDTVNNKMNMRMRTTQSGRDADDSRWEWDFAMVSIGWVVDSSHPTRNYQFAPTGDTLAAGSETSRLAITTAANTGVNTGGWQGTLNDDNLHWTVAGANVVGTNFDAQINFATAKQNGANKLLIQTEFDTDLNIGLNVQICDWVSSTSVDAASDGNCSTGGWRSLVSQTAANADVAYTGTTAVVLQWHIFDGYFTTGNTGGTAISTPLGNFFHASNGIKIRYFSTTQTATNLDIDFLRIQPIIDTVYHPSGVTNLNVSGGALAGTYANAHIIGNSATAQQSVTTADAVRLEGAGTAGSIADYYLSYTGIKTYSGANTIYFKADYSCSAATAGLDTEFAIYNFTSAAWEDLTSATIACSTSDATHGWAKNNVTLNDYISGGEARIRYYGDLNSTTTLRLDFAYIMIGSTNTDTADCQITFGSGTATDCTNTRNLVGPDTAARFDNAAEDESATMGTGDSNAYYAFDNEITPDTTTEEATSTNIAFPVTQPTNSSIVGEHFAARFSGCGNTGNACGAAALTTQLGLKDYGSYGSTNTGGWWQIGAQSANSTLAYTDSITNLSIGVYGQQISPEDLIDTTSNKINLRLRTTTPGTNTTNVTTVWDFAMVSLQWIEIGNTIDIQGNSSVTGLTVAVAVDGVLQVGKTATSAGGGCPCAWTISSVFVGKGRAVLVWHDAASDADESTGITNYDGTGNITGMELTAHTFSVGSIDDQTTTYAELALYDNDVDEDVMYKAVSSAITVDATSTYSDETLDILSGDTLTVGGSETLTTYNLTINGTLTSGGATAYTVQGDYINNGVFNESTSTVTMNGTTSETINSGCSNTDTCTDQNFYNLTLNKTDAADANDNLTLTTNGLRITNTLTLTNGELIQSTLSVRVEGTSAVSIASDGQWTNTSTGDLKLGGTFVNAGISTFNSNAGSQCTNGANDIVISSTSGGSQRAWSGAGTFALYNLDVTDMTDSSITAYNSTFSNTTWSVGVCGVTVSGSCDQYDQTTDCTDDGANQIAVAINGSIQAQVDTTVDGSWSISGVAQPSTNDIITIFIDGETTDNEEAVAVTKYDGTGDITGVILYQRHLTLGSADAPTLSNADIGAYDNSVSGDEDIFFDVSAGDDLTVDSVATYTDEEIYVLSGTTYRPASGGGGDVTTVHVENDGTWTADSNLITVAGNWQNDSTFTAGSGTVTFSSTSSGRTLSGTLSGGTGMFNILNFDGVSGGWTLNANLETGGAMTVTNGTLNTHDTNSYSVTVAGNYTMQSGATVDGNASTFTVSGNWDQNNTTWNTAATGSGTTTVVLAGASKTISTAGTSSADRHFYSLTINGTYTATASERMNILGNFIMNTSSSLSNIEFSPGLHIWNASATVTINGTMSKASSNNGSMWIRSSMPTITSSVGIGVRVDYVIGSVGTHVIPALDYNGGLYFNSTETNTYRLGAGTFNISSTDTGWTILSGTAAKVLTLDNDTFDSTVNVTHNIDFTSAAGSVTANLGSASYSVGQHWVNTDGATVDPGTSTVTFSNATADGDITSASQSFYNVIIDDTADDITPTDALTITNDLTLTAGELNSAQNVTVNGNVGGTAGFTNFSGGTFTQRVAADKNFGATTGSTAWTFSSLTFSNSHGSTPFTITTQTGGTGGITVSSILRVGASGDAAGATTTLNAGNRTWTLSGTAGDPFQLLSSPAGALTGGTSKFYYTGANGGGNTTVQASASSYYDLELNAADTFVLEGATLVSNNLTITTGTLDTVAGQNYALTIGGNYSNSGTFTARGGTVTFTATDTGNTLSGTLDSTSAFYDLTFNGSGGEWTPSAAVAATHNLTVTVGSLLGTQNVTVGHNATGGSGGIINLTGGTFEMASDGDVDFGTTAGSSNWTFSSLTFSYPCGGVCLDGGMVVTTQTGGSGTITVTSVMLVGKSGDGEIVTLDAGNRTWTLSGTAGDPFQLLASPAGALTANTSTFNYTGANGGGNTTVQTATYYNLIINASDTFVLEGTTSTNNDLTITSGTLDTVSGSSHAVNIKGNYSNSGTFTAQLGTVTFTATDAGNTLGGTLSGSSAFYNLIFNGASGEWTPNAAVDITNDLTMTAGSLLGTQNITVNGTIVGTAGVINLTGGTFEQRVAAAENFGATTGAVAWTFSSLTFSNSHAASPFTITTQTGSTGTITVTGVMLIGKSGDNAGATTTLDAGNRTWTLSGTGGNPFQILASPAGVLTANTSTFSYTGNYASDDTIVQVATYYDLVINNGSETYVLEGNTTTNRNLTITAGILAQSGFTLAITGDLSVAGTLSGGSNVSVSGGDATGDGTINLTAGTFTITGTGNFGGDTAWTFSALVIGASGGSASTITATGTGGITISTYLSITGRISGTNVLEAGSKIWTLSATTGTPFCNGGLAVGATLTAQTSEFVYTGNNGGGNTTVCTQWNYYKLTINNASETFDLMGHAAITNNLTITTGTLDAVSGGDFNLTVGGNFANAGTFTPRNGTVTLNGSAQQTVSDTNSGTNTFYALTITNASGTVDPACGTSFTPGVIFSNAVTTTNTFTVTTASAKVQYNSGSAYAFNNINWNGQAGGTKVQFRNSNLSSGTWLLNVTAVGSAQTRVSYVDVGRSDASSGSTIIASDGTNLDCNNNTNWQFDEALTLSLDSTSKTFGTIQPGSNPADQTTTLTATSNSSSGYVIYAWCTQLMTETRGNTISDWTGTNGTPTTFSNPSTGFGYATDDASLTGGTADRFTNGGAKYAGFVHAGPGDPVADRTSAATGATNTINYRLYPSATAANGDYTTTVIYIITAAFP